MKSCDLRPLLLFTVLPLLTACGSGGDFSSLSGTVSVDGTPVESGTVHFQSKTSSKSSGGATVAGGAFNVVSAEGLEPGEYEVVLQAYRKTGRTINDPQKGKVEVTETLTPTDSPKSMQVTAENSQNLALDFSTGK